MFRKDYKGYSAPAELEFALSDNHKDVAPAALEGRFFSAAAMAVLTPKQSPALRPSGHEKADEAGDTQKEEDYDCAINQAKLRLFRAIGRNERSMENMALPADVICNPGHAPKSSIRWASSAGGEVN